MSVVKVTQADWDCLRELERFLYVSHEGPFLTNDALDVLARHRQSAIAELCEGLREARTALDQLDEAASNFSVSGVYFEEPIFTSNCEALEKARAAVERARALLSKHSPDAPGDERHG